MKTAFTLLIPIFCFLTISLSAQYSFGLKAGYADAWEGSWYETKERIYTIPGFHISGLFRYQFNDWLGIGMEPGFVRRGSANERTIYWLYEGNAKVVLNYFEMPIFIQANVQQDDKPIFVFGKLGFGSARLLAGYTELTKAGSSMPDRINEIKYPIFDFRALDFGGYIGGGGGLKFEKVNIFFEARYYHSFKGMTNRNYSYNRFLNRSLDYSLGYIRTF